MTPVGATCGPHLATAVDLCSRCGNFLCGECVDYLDTTPYCESCLAVVTTGPSRRARVSPLLSATGALGMVAGFLVRGRPGLAAWAIALPTGLSGLALSLQELAAIARHEAPTAGARWAAVGRLLGLVHLVLALALAGLFAWFLFKQRTT